MFRFCMRYCAAALFGLALSASAGVAQAQTAFSVEGPITGIDPAKHTITVGYDFVVEIPTTIKFTAPAPLKRAFLSVTPAALKPTITGADLTPLLDVNAPSRVRSILPSDQAVPATVLAYSGGTGTFTGLTTIDANGVVHNTAATADVIMAENVFVGVLQSVDLATGIFVVQGHRCKMNVDERFRSEILDSGNNSVTLTQLKAGIGTICTVQGYMLDGMHHCTTLLAAGALGPQGVTILNANGVIKSSMIAAKGDVGKIIAGQTVSLYNTTTGALIATVPVTVGVLPGSGSWVFNSKTAVTPLPTSITVVTSDGFTATKAMTNK